MAKRALINCGNIASDRWHGLLTTVRSCSCGVSPVRAAETRVHLPSLPGQLPRSSAARPVAQASVAELGHHCNGKRRMAVVACAVKPCRSKKLTCACSRASCASVASVRSAAWVSCCSSCCGTSERGPAAQHCTASDRSVGLRDAVKSCSFRGSPGHAAEGNVQLPPPCGRPPHFAGLCRWLTAAHPVKKQAWMSCSDTTKGDQ